MGLQMLEEGEGQGMEGVVIVSVWRDVPALLLTSARDT